MLSKMTLHEFLLETDFLGATQLLVSYFFSFSFLGYVGSSLTMHNPLFFVHKL